MKIDNSIKPAGAPPSNRVRPQQQRTEATGTPAASDEVKLSPLAGELQAGESQPPVDSARVSEIKRAIAEGRFTINAGAIADRLIDTARELVSSQRRA
ncbi:MAG TPA: flagellar biosynthesis anti-sigma factor FlgM [Rhodocyclaceae bacterium]|nr:flagellar biosynthesis anti-sigma factor FlgM [Rhodocyclaceae bacterium]